MCYVRTAYTINVDATVMEATRVQVKMLEMCVVGRHSGAAEAASSPTRNTTKGRQVSTSGKTALILAVGVTAMVAGAVPRSWRGMFAWERFLEAAESVGYQSLNATLPIQFLT